jgi:preprotein translocase subunit SecB
MQIKLEHIYYNDVKLKVESLDKNITTKLQTSLNFKSEIIKDEELNKFSVHFLLNLKNKNFDLSINSVAVFLTDVKLESDFLESDFCNINAPAIAFPYIRTYVSNLTLNSGFNPIILPSFNFVNLHKEKSKIDK